MCKEEENERRIPPEFDLYEAGSSERLRLLDGFSLYSKDGQLVPLQALDDPSTRCNVIAYGSAVEPMHPNILSQLQKMENSTSGYAIPHKYYQLPRNVREYSKSNSANRITSTMDHHHHLQAGEDGSTTGLQIRKDDSSVGSLNELKIRIKLGNSDCSESVTIPAKRNIQRGHSLRDILYAYRNCGVVFYYNERASLDHQVAYEGCHMCPIERGSDKAGFDRAALTRNSKVDTFCQTTVKWYGAKVVGVSKDNAKVLIHFNGWKKQFDEYVDRRSYRLAAYGTNSTARTELEALTLSRKQQPQTVIYCPPRKRRRIQLSDLQYWCTDYTVAERPILWLVTNHAWYKVKGGDWWDPVEPSRIYASIFETVSTSFHIMGLFLPILRSFSGCSLRELSQKLEKESGGQFCFEDLVESHSFIIDQLEQLGPLQGTLPATEEPFSKQLLAAGEAWERSRQPGSVHKRDSSNSPYNRLSTKAIKPPFTEHSTTKSSCKRERRDDGHSLIDTPPASSKGSSDSNYISPYGEWEGQHVELDPMEVALAAAEGERQRQEALAHLPCPDDILWDTLSSHGEPSLPPPLTSPVPLVVQNPQFKEVFLGDLIASWSFLHMFGSIFDAPLCTLEELMKALCITGHNVISQGLEGTTSPLLRSGGDGAPKRVIPLLLTSIHMSIVDFILQDQVKANSSAEIEIHGDSYWERYFFSCQSSGDPEVPNPGAGGSSGTRSAALRKSRLTQPSYPTTSTSLGGPYGMNTMTADNAASGGSISGSPTSTVEGLRGSWELLRATPMGWLELTRLLYLRKEGINPKRLFDPLGECRRILRHVMDETLKSEDMKFFVKLKSGAGNEITRPPPDEPVKGLNNLWSRLESGWYDVPPDAGELPGGRGGATTTTATAPLSVLKKPKIEIDSCHIRPASTVVLEGENGVCSSPPLRKDMPSSRYGGPKGFIHDVQDMAAFYTSAYGEGAPLTEQASSIVEDIIFLYKGIVELPLRQLELELKDDNDVEFKEEDMASSGGEPGNNSEVKKRKGGCCQVGSSKTAASYKLYCIMSTLEYDQWPIAARVRLLRWLCDEVSATETLRSFCDSILSSGEGLKCKNKEVKNLVKAMRSSSRRTTHHDSTADPTQQTDSELLAAVLAQEDIATKQARAVAELRVRLSPLGSDRLHRRYWLLNGLDPIYVEDRNGRWSSYIGEDSAKALVKWLDDRGTRESHLRKVIISLLVEHYGADINQLTKPSMSCGKRKQPLSTEPRMCASDLDGIEVNWQMRDDVAARHRATLKHHFSKLVLSPSVLAPAFNDAYATSLVLLTFQVPVGLQGLGVGLGQRHSSVIIAEFSTLQTGGPNPSQMAGICLGDELVSVGDIIALTPTQVACSVRETLSIGSGKMVPVKVLRLVKLIDDKNKPGFAAQYGGMLHVVGTLLARESMLAHPYVLGASWNKIHRYIWLQQMVAAVESAANDDHTALDNDSQTGGKEENLNIRRPVTSSSPSTTQEDNRGGLEGQCRSSRRISCSSSKSLVDSRQEDMDELEDFLIRDKNLLSIKQQQSCGAKKVAQCLLQLETALALQGTLLYSGRGWTPARRRKWRGYTAEACTAAQLLVSWASLDGIVEWGILKGVTQPIERTQFLRLVQSQNQNRIPNLGDMVVYFGAGHVSACKRVAELGLRPTWGGDDPIRNVTTLCRVISIIHESSGPPSIPERCEPFVVIELEAVSHPNPLPQAVLLPPISKRSHFSRLLMRVLRYVQYSIMNTVLAKPCWCLLVLSLHYVVVSI